MKHTFRYRVTDEPGPGDVIELDTADAHHLARVVRRRAGDPVELIGPAGRIWPAVVDAVGPPVRIRVGEAPRPAPATAPVDLYIGLLDWGRLDLVVEKITEVGVASLTVVATERGRARGDREAFDRRRARLARILESAARQSGRGGGPELRGLVPFSAVIEDLSPTTGFLVDARGTQSLGSALRAAAPDRAAVLVGPDAGFSASEVDTARQRGLAICRLGDATLRAETAAIVAVALAADALGHLGNGT